MKISVIGAGNVGAHCAMRIAEEGLGEVVLVDVAPGLACGKAFDMEDGRALLKKDFVLRGTEDMQEVRDSDVVVITAGLARRPDMTREDLLRKNTQIVRAVCTDIKKFACDSSVIVVTNPLDVMTYCALKELEFPCKKVFGMGVSLDASRFSNFLCGEFKVSYDQVAAVVVGSHGEEMMPLPRFTYIKGVSLDQLAEKSRVQELVKRTKERGKEIVSLLGTGSAYFAPSAAVLELVRALVKDQKISLAVSAYLNGEYGVKDICIGVPCLIGRNGVEKIIELELNKEEKDAFVKSAEAIRALVKQL